MPVLKTSLFIFASSMSCVKMRELDNPDAWTIIFQFEANGSKISEGKYIFYILKDVSNNIR